MQSDFSQDKYHSSQKREFLDENYQKNAHYRNENSENNAFSNSSNVNSFTKKSIPVDNQIGTNLSKFNPNFEKN